MSLIVCIFALLALNAYADSNVTEQGDINIFTRIALDDLITLASSVLAIVLFALTFIAYRRSGRSKLAYVSAAFFLYAVKGFINASDLFLPVKSAWADPTANFLDFAILLCFFIGIMRK